MRRIETASSPSASAMAIAASTIAARVSPPGAGFGSSQTISVARFGIDWSLSRDTVYGMSDTAYGETGGSTMTPALKRLSTVVILGMVMTVLDTTIVNVAIATLGD